MEIGGYDHVFDTPAHLPVVDVSLRRIRHTWPNFVAESADGTHEFNNSTGDWVRLTAQKDLLIYRDAESKALWDTDANDPQQDDTMINLIYDPSKNSMTLVLGSEIPSLMSIVDDLRQTFGRYRQQEAKDTHLSPEEKDYIDYIYRRIWIGIFTRAMKRTPGLDFECDDGALVLGTKLFHTRIEAEMPTLQSQPLYPALQVVYQHYRQQPLPYPYGADVFTQPEVTDTTKSSVSLWYCLGRIHAGLHGDPQPNSDPETPCPPSPTSKS
jgi:hypothetical protein